MADWRDIREAAMSKRIDMTPRQEEDSDAQQSPRSLRRAANGDRTPKRRKLLVQNGSAEKVMAEDTETVPPPRLLRTPERRLGRLSKRKLVERKFSGLYSAVVTPFAPDGQVNVGAIDGYAKLLKSDGVTGVFVCGTAGSSMSLSVPERKEITAAWVAAGKKHGLEVLVHVGAQSAEDGKELARHAEECGVHAISCMAPCFFKPASVDLLASYVASVASSAPNTPFLYYHFPEITGVSFPMADVFKAMETKVPTLCGAKFTSTNMWDLGNTIDFGTKKGKKYSILMGYEGQTTSCLPLGVEGHIGIAFSVIAPVWVRLLAAYKAKDMAKAEEEQRIGRAWFGMFSEICGLWQMAAVTKLILGWRLGVDLGGMRVPQRDLTDEETRKLKAAWEQFQSEHPNLLKLPSPQPAAGAAALPDDFTQLPGAQGRLRGKIRERVDHVAQKLELDPSDIYDVLPHLNRLSKLKPVDTTNVNVADYIDHTLLKADASTEDIRKLCKEAKEHRFFAVCVNSSRVAECATLLSGTQVGLASVVGFPLGAMDHRAKAKETLIAVGSGAQEIDMVLNVGKLKEDDLQAVFNDIRAVCVASKKGESPAIVKVIFETCLLSDEQIIDASILSALAGAEYVKTSTGFSTGGATPHAVDIMKAVVGDVCMVKASGGVKDVATAMKYIAAGVKRIGTSSGVAIVTGAKAGAGY